MTPAAVELKIIQTLAESLRAACCFRESSVPERQKVDPDTTDTSKPGAPEKGEERRKIVDRAVRHDLRLPLRYRREGQQDWTLGETINVSESGLLFTADELLEIDARVEITFQTSGPPLLQRSTRVATVVRRILSNWPETRVVFGARYSL